MKRSAQQLLLFVALVVLAFLTAYPFLFMFVNSFKTVSQFYHDPWWFPIPPVLENYADAWAALVPFLANSIVVCLISTLAVILLGFLTGYAFARFRFPAKEFCFFLVLAMMMIPGVLMLVPSFLLANDLQLMDTYHVMILFYVSTGQIIATFLFRNAIETIPEDLFQAAQIDGANTFQTMRHVAVPLCKPVAWTVGIITAIACWNNFLWPYITTNREEVKVITNGILEFSNAYTMSYGIMFAGFMLASLPMLLLILVAMRAFIRGVTAGSIKG